MGPTAIPGVTLSGVNGVNSVGGVAIVPCKELRGRVTPKRDRPMGKEAENSTNGRAGAILGPYSSLVHETTSVIYPSLPLDRGRHG